MHSGCLNSNNSFSGFFLCFLVIFELAGKYVAMKSPVLSLQPAVTVWNLVSTDACIQRNMGSFRSANGRISSVLSPIIIYWQKMAPNLSPEHMGVRKMGWKGPLCCCVGAATVISQSLFYEIQIGCSICSAVCATSFYFKLKLITTECKGDSERAEQMKTCRLFSFGKIVRQPCWYQSNDTE